MAADSLKQRLVGGATLLLIGVIAWFWLLSADSPVDPVDQKTQIPAQPDIKPFAVQEPVAPKDIQPVGSQRDSTPVLRSDVVPQPDAEPQPAKLAVEKNVVIERALVVEKSGVVEKNSVAEKSSAAEKIVTEKKAELKAAMKVEPQPAAPKKLVPETFELDQHGLPVAWVVQVGVFSTQAKADSIKQTLQDNGFKAYSENFKAANVSGVKVYVGPKLSRERADAQKKAIDQLLKTNTMVVRFPPT